MHGRVDSPGDSLSSAAESVVYPLLHVCFFLILVVCFPLFFAGFK